MRFDSIDSMERVVRPPTYIRPRARCIAQSELDVVPVELPVYISALRAEVDHGICRAWHVDVGRTRAIAGAVVRQLSDVGGTRAHPDVAARWARRRLPAIQWWNESAARTGNHQWLEST